MRNIRPGGFLCPPLSLLCGATAVAALYALRQRTTLSRHGTRVRGEIIALQFISLTRRHPVVRFPGPDGQLLTLPAADSVNDGEYHPGEQVDVSYPPDDPARFIIVAGFDILLEAPPHAGPTACRKARHAGNHPPRP